jgi:hypothetical protein
MGQGTATVPNDTWPAWLRAKDAGVNQQKALHDMCIDCIMHDGWCTGAFADSTGRCCHSRTTCSTNL